MFQVLDIEFNFFYFLSLGCCLIGKALGISCLNRLFFFSARFGVEHYRLIAKKASL